MFLLHVFSTCLVKTKRTNEILIYELLILKSYMNVIDNNTIENNNSIHKIIIIAHTIQLKQTQISQLLHLQVLLHFTFNLLYITIFYIIYYYNILLYFTIYYYIFYHIYYHILLYIIIILYHLMLNLVNVHIYVYIIPTPLLHIHHY